MKKYDAVIIGSGQAGVPLAKKIAAKGLKVAIIESKLIGGTCINYGCTPTKTMVASARMAYLARHSKEVGINTGKVTVDIKAIVKRKNTIVLKSRTGAKNGLTKVKNIDVIYGEASFAGSKEIHIKLHNGSTTNISGKDIFINTGARPSIPSINGLDQIDYLDSTTIMELKEIPKHLLIVGASYIALEFGQMFRRFGSKVTILEQAENFLPKEDADVSKEIQKFLEEEELTIYTNAAVERFSKKGKSLSATVKINKATKLISCSHVLIAAGRTPNTDMLHLENTAIKTEKNYIQVNDELETGEPGVYALGDVKGGPAFTHIAYNDYLVVCGNIYDKQHENIKNRMVPYTMFTDPQFGRVGVNEKEAQQQQLHYKVVCISMQHVARAIETNATKGFIKAIVDMDTQLLLGAAVIGEQGGEIMSMLQLAMMGKIPYTVLRCAVFAHPLYAEALNNLFLELDSDR